MANIAQRGYTNAGGFIRKIIFATTWQFKFYLASRNFNLVMMKIVSAPLLLILNLQVFAQQTTVTATEAKELGIKMEAAVINGDTSFLHTLIDTKSLVKNIEVKSKALKNTGFKRGFLETFNMGQFGDQTIAVVKSGGYKMLKGYEKEGKEHLLFRAYGTGGFNYQDFTLIKVGSAIKVEDVYSYISGENLSTTLATTLDAEFNSADSKDAITQEAKVIIQIGKYKKQGNYIEEKELFEKLETNLQNNKGIQMLYIDACRHINMGLYKTAIEKYVSLYPNEANAYLMMIDVYSLNKEYEKGIGAIEKLDSLLGGDPYLYFYEGLLYKKAGKLAESKANFEKCFDAEPTIIVNMQQLTDDYYIEGDYEKAKAVINNYKKTPNFKPDDLAPLYKAYPSLKDSL